MYDRKTFIAIALGLQTFGSSASAADPAKFDVAGIRLGDTPQQVKTALMQAGYKITEVREAQSFSQRVTAEIANRKGKTLPSLKDAAVSVIIASGPHQERADVQFLQLAGGDSVSRVSIAIPGTSMTEAAMQKQLATKYGKPDAIMDQGLTWHWCAPQAVKICGMLYTGGDLDTVWPTLRGSTAMGENSITLEAGTDAERQQKRAFDAAVLSGAPKTDKAAF